MIKPEDALEWYKFGFNVVPIDPGEKSTAVKWQPWLDNLSDKTIIHHWKKHPGHELGAIIDDQLFVLDADSEEVYHGIILHEELAYRKNSTPSR